MTPSLRSHIANVLQPATKEMARQFRTMHIDDIDFGDFLADALLADPVVKAIIDLAAFQWDDPDYVVPPEVRALLADWRAER